MDSISVNRWRRYGHDRAYAMGADGTKLGWMDLVSETVTIEEGADAEATRAALLSWHAEHVRIETGNRTATSELATAARAKGIEASTPATQVNVTEDSATPNARKLDSEDIAGRPPGYLARERASLEWERQKRIGTVLATLGKVFDVHTNERAWRKGAEGEEHVGRTLDRLTSKGWRTLHSIPMGKDSDIDHLAIGPGGVIMINTKHHPRAKVSITKYAINVNGKMLLERPSDKHY